jgi:hypothetical protein
VPCFRAGWYRKRNPKRKVTLLLMMGTRRSTGSPGRLSTIILVVATAASCGGAGAGASHSPAPASAPASPSASSPPQASAATASPSPVAVTGAYGVLVGAQSGATYTVSLVGTDAKVVASAQGSTPAAVTCANAAAGVVPLPVSTSNSRVYFMDGQGVVRFLSPSGDTGRATTVPSGAARRSMFAVSPEDQRIAVVVDDFNSTGAATRLYVEDLNGGGNHVELFTESGAYTLWPIGWHGTNNLVVAKVPACTQGGGPFCCGPQELHVVDPATAVRRFTLGGSGCVIAGPPSAAGAICESNSNFTQATVLNWTAATVRTLAINGPAFTYLSPSGGMVAFVDNTGTSFTIGAASISGTFACTWIDDEHILSGGDAQHQPRVVAVISGTIAPVAAQGDCGGRLPGGL